MLSRKVYVSQFGMNMKLMSLRLVLIALVLALGSLWSDAHATTAAHAYVTVSCSTYGVEDIVPIGADFHITTRNVSKPSFRADITVRANKPYCLVDPPGGRMNLGIGESDGYRVRDESGSEDEFSGRVHVLKLDIGAVRDECLLEVDELHVEADGRQLSRRHGGMDEQSGRNQRERRFDYIEGSCLIGFW